MEFTGERYIPSEVGQIKYEHLHRYALCMPFVSGKVVLDLASGEGYGAALMADVADSVVGVDISEDTVAHAKHRYYRQNLTFLVGSCADIPLPDASVEVVTSFETIEHHDQHEEMLGEIKRVLRPGGTLIISSPNRLTYSDEPNYSNPFHVKELYFDEFNSLLGRYFKHVYMYGQRLAAASFVYSLTGSQQSQLTSYQGVDRLIPKVPCLSSPIYFVSVCSDDAAAHPLDVDSIYLDASDDLLKKIDCERLHLAGLLQERTDAAEQLNAQLSQATSEIAQQTQELTKVREGYEEQIDHDKLHLSEVHSAYETQIKSLQDELSHERSSYDARLAQLSEARSAYETQIKSLQDELSHERSSYEARLAQFADAQLAAEAQLSAVRDLYETRIEELSSLLTEAQSRLSQQDSSLKTIGAQLSAVEGRLSVANSELGKTEAALRTRDENLLWIQSSRAWHWGSFLRTLFDSRGARWMRRGLRSSFSSGLHSSLDSPTDDADAVSSIRIEGWAFSRVPIIRIEAFLDNFYLGNVQYGILRRDVLDAYPALAVAACGFSGLFELPPALVGKRKLLVRIYDERGNLQLYVRSLTVQPSERSHTPSPVLQRTEDDSTAEQPVISANEYDPVYSEFKEVFERVKSKVSREPSVLDVGVNLNLQAAFPDLAIFSPVAKNSPARLPYLDRSIDLVLVSADDHAGVEEARRLAAVAVVQVFPSQPESSNGSPQSRSTGSRVRLKTDWLHGEDAHQSGANVSIIIPVYNNSSYTAGCLEQLRRTVPDGLCDEVIVVDDASTDETESLLERWAADEKRIKIIRNERNLGFIHSCNRGAEAATGDVLVFLNNDTLPQTGWLRPLVQVLREKPNAGAVGAKLIYPDGTLQEAGGIIFADGTGCNFGRNFKSANSPLFNFLREVDYCSGAVLATPRELFLSLGGFDTHFAPAYYEDTDYCFRLRELGYIVYYQPESVIIHFEGITSGTSIESGVKSYQKVNRSRFINRWKEVLKRQPPAPDEYDFATLQRLSIRNGTGNVNGD